MTTFEVVEGKPWHAGQMARIVRNVHVAALGKASLNVHRDLATTAGGSIFCRAWLIDGKLAALGGVNGPISSATGYIWLAVSDEATKHPLAMIREAKRQIAEIMETRRELRTACVAGDVPSMEFAIFLGFVPEGTEDIEINGVWFIPLIYSDDGWMSLAGMAKLLPPDDDVEGDG